MDYKARIKELREILEYNSKLYYDLDAPVMPDYEYDRLMRELEDLEAAHPEEITPESPTQHVGGTASNSFAPVTHEVPLESLQDVFSEAEVADHYAGLTEEDQDKDWKPFNRMLQLLKKYDGTRIYSLEGSEK